MNTEDIIPEGRYLAFAKSGAIKKTSTGKDQASVLFEISAPESHAGRTIFWNGYFTEKTVDRTLEALELCGWGGDDLSDLSAIDGSNECQIVVEHEDDLEGYPRARVRWVNPPGGGAVKGDADAAASLNARLRGKLLARKQAGKPISARATRPDVPKAAAGGDDIPF